ncbi:MAG: hypothetical protein A2X37_08155 [Elusimicrobia bacterium GWA2_66_18]|nr:MAG: hypothetical protein A2X37_08155 [Elusimicrobia bacterium GWA2_66_18]
MPPSYPQARARIAAGEEPPLEDILSFIKATAKERGDELKKIARLRPGALERQGAFLEYMVALETLPKLVWDDIASSRLTYEFYDSRNDVITMDRQLAPASKELLAAILLHSLRHYFAVSRKEPRARGDEGQHDAFEAQAIFWTVIRTEQAGLLNRHHDALASAYARGALPELMERFKDGWLW